MLFQMRHKTYAGQVLDVLVEASSLERATLVAGAYCKKQGHSLVYVKAAVVADESILPAEVRLAGDPHALMGGMLDLVGARGETEANAAADRLAAIAQKVDSTAPAPAGAVRGLPVVTGEVPAGVAGLTGTVDPEPPKVDRMAAARAAKAAKKAGEAA